MTISTARRSASCSTMTTDLPRLPALLAAAMLVGGSALPSAAGSLTMQLCTGSGYRTVTVPAGGEPKPARDCDKACHAACERRKSAPGQRLLPG